jgi:hypothetical protein
MSLDPTAPIETAPPRQVHKWMRVRGHDVRKPQHTIGGPVMHCTCGWQTSEVDVDAAESQAGEHQANAWPVLIPRPDGPIEQWVEVLEEELREAQEVEDRLDQAAGDGAIQPGQSFPIITEESALAHDRVRVIRHQLRDVRTKAGLTTAHLGNVD